MAIADRERVAVILGESDVEVVEDIFLTMADNYVKTLLNRNFNSNANSQSDYFDTERRNLYYAGYNGHVTFSMSKTPINSFTSLIHMPNDSDGGDTLTEDTDYYLDLSSGLFTLTRIFEDKMNTGQRTLKATYTWGYALAPAEVIDFASMIAARMQESRVAAPVNADGALLKEVEIGRYRESYATPSTMLKGKYEGIAAMESLLVQKYKVWE